MRRRGLPQPLRLHSEKNFHQHHATLVQIANPDPAAWDEWLQWFAGLPLSLDLGGLRAVHACWDDDAIGEMHAAGMLNGAVLEEYSRRGTPSHDRISRIINGPEARLPEGLKCQTADGTEIPEMRVKWWLELDGKNCREAIFPDNPEFPEVPLRDIPKTG